MIEKMCINEDGYKFLIKTFENASVYLMF